MFKERELTVKCCSKDEHDSTMTEDRASRPMGGAFGGVRGRIKRNVFGTGLRMI
ncbi:hypothetical protein LFL96_12575 [Paraburkholderia sp. D15]|uniref:hypothetical protein n=1 Tax=Paraburkholderia sp. D15 TaxID=2880218 RepID=UPI002479FEC6|nr:hypothetical protein [Paraburkholderia sp. D15]WGS48623.1 hypothetical protein LFL96_12575 [Paraburkholderia sp. D15]